jgi:hypothetical protein
LPAARGQPTNTRCTRALFRPRQRPCQTRLPTAFRPTRAARSTYDEAALTRDVGIRFKGAEKTNVEEYCVSEGWIRVAAGNAKDRFGNPLTIKLTGTVKPYFKNPKA